MAVDPESLRQIKLASRRIAGQHVHGTLRETRTGSNQQLSEVPVALSR
jgi:hypothetical protein